VTADAMFAKWDGWLSTIHEQVRGLLVNRHIFREVQAIIQENPKIQLASSFYEWMGNTYATTAVIGVRRQLDKGHDSISFARPEPFRPWTRGPGTSSRRSARSANFSDGSSRRRKSASPSSAG
jgi:hypothetical protein